MTFISRGLTMAALAALAASAAPAGAVGIQLQGAAPIVCSASLTPDGATAQIHEFCNSPAGYDTFIDYPEELEGAILTIDGQAFTLADGSVRVTNAAGPAAAEHDLAIDTGAARALDVRIVPHGG